MGKLSVLITGGAGYTSSYTSEGLFYLNYDVIVVDNLSNSREKVLKKVE